jgi:uncharacterized protein (DUF342 family)
MVYIWKNYKNIFKVLIMADKNNPSQFVKEKDRISIRVTQDALKAYIILFMDMNELQKENWPKIVKEIGDVLKQSGIVYGINSNLLSQPLEPEVEYLIAEGTPAQSGEDSKIRLYEPAPLKPQIIDSNNVNYYELNLINHVKAGDWLGERIDATKGMPGKDVYDREIPAVQGRNHPLLYDKVSVEEQYQNGITTLISKKNGAVYFDNGSIGVYDFLEVKGDVDFSTGNIDFDGFLTVKGSVSDNFSIIATKDIEILGDYGIGAVNRIESTGGNIYIKGGINGRGKSVIRCKKNLYAKYLSDITVECEGSVYVGFYCMNSNIRAKQVIVQSPDGRISGGKIDADVLVSAAEIGSRAEVRTIIRVRGFDQQSLKAGLDSALAEIKELKALKEADNRDRIRDLDYICKSLREFLKVPAGGAIMAKKHLYPRVRIEVKGVFEEITHQTGPATYVAYGIELKSIP